jgi:uncharacterized protein (TIGR00251 family)
VTVTPQPNRTNGGFLIDVKVSPSAKEDVVEFSGGEIKVKTREPADKDKANRAVLRLLKPYFGRCSIVFGHKSRKKKILAEKMDYKSP